MYRGHLLARGGRFDHPDCAVQQQKEPFGHGAFVKHGRARIKATAGRLIKDRSDLRLFQSQEGWQRRQQAFI